MTIVNKIKNRLIGAYITFEIFRYSKENVAYHLNSNMMNIFKDTYTGDELIDYDNVMQLFYTTVLMNSFKYRYETANPSDAQKNAIVLQNPVVMTEEFFNSGNHDEMSYTLGDFTRLQTRSIIIKDDGSWSVVLGSSPINGIKGYEEKLTLVNYDRGLVSKSKNELSTTSNPMLFGHNISKLIERHSTRKVM